MARCAHAMANSVAFDDGQASHTAFASTLWAHAILGGQIAGSRVYHSFGHASRHCRLLWGAGHDWHEYGKGYSTNEVSAWRTRGDSSCRQVEWALAPSTWKPWRRQTATASAWSASACPLARTQPRRPSELLQGPGNAEHIFRRLNAQPADPPDPPTARRPEPHASANPLHRTVMDFPLRLLSGLDDGPARKQPVRGSRLCGTWPPCHRAEPHQYGDCNWDCNFNGSVSLPALSHFRW